MSFCTRLIIMCIFFPTLAATFVSFLLEVDSIYEVHDYIKSYLGETPEAHDFAKQFLERRQKLKPPANQQSQVSFNFKGALLACMLTLMLWINFMPLLYYIIIIIIIAKYVV